VLINTAHSVARKLQRQCAFEIVVLFLVMSNVAIAQQNRCVERTIPLSVRTTKSGLDTTLSTSDLQGSYQGKPVQIGGFVSAKTKPRVLYLVEMSEDMERTGALEDWNFPLDLARALIARTPADVHVGIAFFTTTLQHTVRPTADRNKLMAEIETVRSLRGEALREVGDPPLWDVIRDATDLLAPAQVGDAIYAIVHGGEHGSKASAQLATISLSSEGIRLFAVMRTFQAREGRYGAFSFQPTESQKQLMRIVDDTGGTLIDVPKGSGLSIPRDFSPSSRDLSPVESALDEAFQPLFRVYPLLIHLPQPVDKLHQLRLDLRNKKDGVHLIYPKTLVPCA